MEATFYGYKNNQSLSASLAGGRIFLKVKVLIFTCVKLRQN